jgi:hypothetical protein
MNIRALLCVVPVMAACAFAQQSGTGTFVLSQTSAISTSLAKLTIGSDGSVIGNEVVQTSGTLSTYALQGMFASDTDGTKTLTLNGTSVDDTEETGAPATTSQSIKLAALPAGGYAGVWTRRGQNGMEYGTGTLYPAGSSLTPGKYFVDAKDFSPTAATTMVIAFDSAGSISGTRLKASSADITQDPSFGSAVATANGFYSVQLKTGSTTATYLALPTFRDVEMIRVDRAAGLLYLTK